ncbi:MAG: hypothetical protein ACI9MR_004233 [Myxococcota bacterium]|jgi:hypothetical protein
MPCRIPTALGALCLCLFLAGCPGGSEVQGRLASGITTTLSPNVIRAGETAGVGCELLDFKGQPGSIETIFSVTSSGDVTVTEDSVSTTVAGTYVVRCSAPRLGLEDTEGTTLTVVAGDPVVIRPVFDDNPLTAGETTGARCAAIDQYGNAAPIDGTLSGPPELTFGTGTVTSDDAGLYAVNCTPTTATNVPNETGTLVVSPGAPVGVTLLVNPDRLYFSPGAVVTLSWIVADRFGNAIEGVPATFSAPEAAGIEVVDAELRRYKLLDEGRYTFSVTVMPVGSGAMTDSLTLTVDGSGPELVITWPPRGETLEGNGAAITIQGRITDIWSGVENFQINGEGVSIGADGSFSHPMVPAWGVNLIDARAADAAGNAVKLTPSYQYSTIYTPFLDTTAEGIKTADGMTMLLGQAFFDDGVHDRNELNDLATIMEVLIGDVDVATTLTDALAQFNQTIPIADFSQTFGDTNLAWVELDFSGVIEITIASATTTDIGPTYVGIDSRDGGIDFDITMGDAAADAFSVDLTVTIEASFDLAGSACTPLGCLPILATQAYASAQLLSGAALESLALGVDVNISKVPGQPVQITFQDYDFALSGLDIDPIQDVVFEFGLLNFPFVNNIQLSLPLSQFIDLNALIGGLLDPIADLLTGLLPPLLNPLIESLAGPLLEGLFEAVEIDAPIELPSLLNPNAPPASLDLFADLSTVLFTDDGGTLGLATGVFSERVTDREPLGAIVRDGCINTVSETLSWDWVRSVGIGIKTDVLNAAFFAAWWTGYLDGPLDPSVLGATSLPIPIENLQLNLRWLMAPIVNDCSKSSIDFQVGDLFIELSGTFQGQVVTATLYADLGFGATFVTSAGGLSARIGELQFNDFEVVTVEQGDLPLDLTLVVEDLLPGLIGGLLVGQEIGPFNLPATDLGATTPGLPLGTTIGLGNLSVSPQDGYVIVGGDLE